MTDTTIIDNRSAGRIELERAEQAEREAQALVAAREAELNALNNGPIQGDDPRLVPLWNKVRRIAVGSGYGDFYDTLADALGGVPREREFTVTFRVTVDVDVPVQVTATGEDNAEEAARAFLTREHIANTLHGTEWDAMTIQSHQITED